MFLLFQHGEEDGILVTEGSRVLTAAVTAVKCGQINI